MITKKQKAEKTCSISGLTCKGMYPILGQRHLNGRIILCSTKYVHPIKSRSVPADEFGSSAACILISNTFQPYVLHKYGKDPIIASRSQSGHDTKHLRSLLHQRYNCQKKGVTEQKRGRRPRQFSPSAFVVRPTQSHCRYNMCYAAVEFQSGMWKLSSQGSKIGSELTMN